MKVVIVEDEAVAAGALEIMITEFMPDCRILAILQSIKESVKWFAENPAPDLIFMDIHLADGSSFRIFDKVRIDAPVIFTTAYDEYALKAFEVNSIDYLLKPIARKDMERALGKFRERGSFTPAEGILKSLLSDLRRATGSYKRNFLVADRDRFIPVSVNDIAYIYTEFKLIKAVTFAGKSHVIDNTLDEVSAALDPEKFFRANRQFIIARAAVKDISVWFGGKLALNLSVDTPTRITISKARAREFKKWIGY